MTAVTVGTFDGVHRGHRAVIDRLVTRARMAGRTSTLVTFEPHPLSALRPAEAPGRLTTRAERTAELAQTELDCEVVLRFDQRLAGLSPEAFVEQVLIGKYGMTELVVGHDHGFGQGRRGDPATLQALGRRLGFAVEIVEPVSAGSSEVVSSSAIRQAVAAAEFRKAAELLGRPYRVSGQVQRGEQRGRTLGVPTVNLAPPLAKLLPPDGVYAVRVEWGGGVAGGMMNQGSRPTVADGRRWLEAHLFDFDGDLYGREIRLEWVAPLRSTRRFDSLEALRNQLEDDRHHARAVLAGAGNL